MLIRICVVLLVFVLQMMTSLRIASSPMHSRSYGLTMLFNSLSSTSARGPDTYPPNPRVNKYEIRFEQYCDAFKSYSFEEVSSIQNDRFKLLVWGGMDALTQPTVVKAFEVLYVDITLVRVAGDFLFKNLDGTIKSAKGDQDKRIRKLLNTLSINTEEKTSLRNKYLEYWPLMRENTTIGPYLKTNSGLYYAYRGRSPTFEEFITFLYDDLIRLQQVEQSTVEDVIDGGLRGSGQGSELTDSKTSKDQKIDKYNRRFMNMCRTFATFESSTTVDKQVVGEYSVGYNSDTDSTTDNDVDSVFCDDISCDDDDSVDISKKGRMRIVLDGCIQGASNEGVLTALGIIYADYLPIRIAGDLIFKLVMAYAPKT